MSTLTRIVLRHRLLVALFWAAVTAVAVVSLPSATGALSDHQSLPGHAGFRTSQQIEQTYGNGGLAAPLVPVVTLPTGTTVDSPGVREELAGVFARIQAAAPAARIVSYPATGDRSLVSADGRTVFGLVYIPSEGGDTNDDASGAVSDVVAASTVGGAPMHLTGLDELESDAGSGGHGVLAETIIGGVGALIILIFVFASFVALLPLVVAIVSIVTTLLLIWGLTAVIDVSTIVEFLVSLIGLGVAIDYSLLIVTRWREERARGLENTAAVRRAMDTAGHAVVFSGATVGIGLLSLVFLPVPFVRGIGLGGLLIPIVSVAVATTLLPVVLATIGPRIDWPRVRKEEHMSAGWAAWTRGVVRWRWAAALGASALLVALVIAATTLSLGNPRASSLAKTGDAHDGLVALQDAGIGPGPLSPVEVLVPAAKADALRGQLAQIDGVRGAVAPDGPAWRRDGTAVIDVLPKDEQLAGNGRQTLDRIRDTVRPAGGDAGGQAAVSADFIDALYGDFPLILGAILIVTFVLLAVAFRSVLLPLKAVLLNVLSVAATYGIVVLIWQHGFGSHAIWGIDSTGAITEWIPLMIFAFLFGLSMDYEVFILARMREEYDASGSTHQAVIAGIGRTGRLVTSAAMILFLAFIVLSTAPDTSLKIVATGLAAGILLDATVVRSLLVPALVALFGEWNWWMPSWGRRRAPAAVRDAREPG